MIDNFYIVTLNRVNDQRTYDSIPPSWKQRTKLVVQSHEVKKYDDKYDLVILPEDITTINRTREFVITSNVDKRFALLDDDLVFTKTRGLNEDGPSNLHMTEKDFDDLEETISNWMDEGFIHCGLDAT